MKKAGYVVKIIKENNYLEVLDCPSLPCCDLSNLSSVASSHNDGMQLHDCSTCSACTSFFGNKEEQPRFNTIKVYNKEKRQVKIGERIEYSVSRWSILLQIFLFLLLPAMTFAFTFSILFLYNFSESTCIFTSLFSFILVAITSAFASRLFLMDSFFMPKIV